MSWKVHNTMPEHPHVIIVGGGFAGIECAKALKGVHARITLIDRQNHHLFQPLLYQVATSALAAPSIASPIREVFAKRDDVQVLMDEVCDVDPAGPSVTLASGRRIEADYLVLAAGLRAFYFGNDDWKAHAPPLKTVGNAIEIRTRFVSAFEAAELLGPDADRTSELTFVVIGAGPTGVEMAGAFAELSHKSLRSEYRHFDSESARVVLIEGQDRVLPTFKHQSSSRALRDLQQLGVEVVLNTRVEQMDSEGVTLSDGQRINTHTIVWAAGVAGERIGSALESERTRADKVIVGPDLSVPGYPNIFVAGDLAHAIDRKTKDEIPGVAPAAIQMGKYVGYVIKREIIAKNAGKSPQQRAPFKYRDKGSLATIGRNRAVAEMKGKCFAGYPAFLLWAIVHIYFLIGYRNRIMTMLQWFWQYILYDRSARIIPSPEHDCQAKKTMKQ